MDYFIMLAGLGMVMFASYFISAIIYRRMAKRGRKAAIALSILLFLAGIFIIGFLVLWYLAAQN